MFPEVLQWYLGVWNSFNKAKVKRQQVVNGQAAKNRQLKDLYVGKRCFIVGNGPSLKKQDLTLLENEYCFCCNFMALTPAYLQIKPEFYVLADPNFFTSDKGIAILNEMLKSGHVPEVFVPSYQSHNWDCSKDIQPLIESGKLHTYPIAGVFMKDTAFRCDMASGISPAFTVTQHAAMIAAYMGFSEIYLLGCDGTGIKENVNYWLNTWSDDAHFYESKPTPSDGKPQKSAEALYQEMSDIYEGHTRIIQGYKCLELMCNKSGIRLYNATEGGIINFLPTCTLSDALGKKN